MEIDELRVLMESWLQGSISNADKLRLRDFYIQRNNFAKVSCTTCPGFWYDVQHDLRYYLKQNGIITVKKEPKYIFAEGITNVREFGSGILYVMEGEEKNGVKILTDATIPALLERVPEFSQSIIENPLYVAGDETEATVTTTAAKVTAPAKAAKATAPKAAKEPKAAKTKPAEPVVISTPENEPETTNVVTPNDTPQA